jgi:inosine-uridine nucleoside N-ribohydrolase
MLRAAVTAALAALLSCSSSTSALPTSMAFQSLPTSPPKPIRVILDTDIGDDFDDTWALLLLLSRPDVYDVQLVQTSTFNTTMRAQVAGLILDTLGRLDVPLAVGAYTGDKGMAQYSIAKDYSLDTFTAHGGNLTFGTGLMEALLLSGTPADPVYVVEIAPATSLGSVVAANPAAAANAVCTAMSGSIYKGYTNSSSPSAEYNVHEDVAASQAVYNATWLRPLATAPLDTTVFMQFFGGPYQTLLAANATGGNLYASTLMANYEAWYSGGGHGFSALYPFSPATGTSTLYDALAAYMTGFYAGWRGEVGGKGAGAGSSDPTPPPFPFLVTRALPVTVNGGGFTVVDPSAPGVQTVFPTLGFPDGVGVDIDAIAADIVGSIVAAPARDAEWRGRMGRRGANGRG